MMETFDRNRLKDELQRRALREIGGRDEEGALLKMNYRQKQAVKQDAAAAHPLVERRIRRTRSMLWIAGLVIPAILAVEIYVEVYRFAGGAPEGPLDRVVAFVVPALWALFIMGWALKVALPRISALERARALLQLSGEIGEPEHELVAVNHDTV